MLKRFFLPAVLMAASLLLTSAPLQATINSPQEIAGLAVWLDGMSIAGADGVDLPTWTDSSPNGYDATNGLSAFVQTPPEITSDTIGTTVGAKAASFNSGSFGGTDALEISLWHPTQGDYTIFVLARIPDTPGLPDFQGYLVGQDFTGSNAGESVFGIGDAMGSAAPDSLGELALTNDGASEGGASKIVATGNSADADNLWHIYSVIVRDNPAGGVGSDVTLNIDGTDVASGQIDSNGIWGSNGVQPVTIAGNFGGSNENALGVDIAQVLIYSGALSANDFASVGFYLEQTYGLTTAFDTPPGFVLSSQTTASVVEGAATDSYTLVLDRQPTSAVTVDLTADAAQVTVAPLQVVFDQNDFDTPQTILVTAVDDNATEAHPHPTIISHSVSHPGGSQEFDAAVVPDVTVSIGENDCGFGPFSPMDFNQDCSVDIWDYALFTSEWLDCSIDNSLGVCPSPQILRFGVVNDVHHTLYSNIFSTCFIFDNTERLNRLAAEMTVAGAEFIVSVGDNCHEAFNGSLYTPQQYADNLESYKQGLSGFAGNKYYVLGNHEGSSALTNAEMLAIWHDPATNNFIPETFYFFDRPEFKLRFIILDAQFNADGTPKGASPPSYGWGFIPPAEQTWLSNRLAETRNLGYHAILFCHQRIDEQLGLGITNSAQVRSLIEANSDVVPLVIEAHNHADGHQVFNSVNYITTYSAPFFHCSDTDPHDDWRLVEVGVNTIKIIGSGNASSLTINY